MGAIIRTELLGDGFCLAIFFTNRHYRDALSVVHNGVRNQKKSCFVIDCSTLWEFRIIGSNRVANASPRFVIGKGENIE
jgi:hypothetical protein